MARRAGRPRKPLGWGRVRQLPSGNWQARVPDPHRPGRLIPAPQRFSTRTDAERWLAGQRAAQDRGAWVDPAAGKITLAVYADDWLAHRPDLRPRTCELYRGLLDRHVLPALGSTEIGRLTSGRVRGWHAGLLTGGLGPTTVAKAYRLLRTVLATAVADELIVKNPCQVRGASVERAPERPVATIAEVQALADAIEPRYRCAVLLAAWCGLRKAELQGLRRLDLDPMRGTVRVEQTYCQTKDGAVSFGPPKTEAGRRTIAVPPHLAEEVTHHLATFVGSDPAALVFTGAKGGPVRPHVLQTAWNRARQATGLVHLHLHDLRHAGNTWAAATGASTRELMARMGHASPVAALGYQHATADRDRAIADALSGLIPPARVVPIRPKADEPSLPTPPELPMLSESDGGRT